MGIYIESKRNKRPEGATEWTFADWFGEDLTGKEFDGGICVYDGGIIKSDITSLKGSPRIVHGDFDISNSNLSTLEFSPEVIDGSFNVSNNLITSLECFPAIVGKHIVLRGNPCLSSIAGINQQVIDGNLMCSGCGLKSLIGCPKVVNGDFYCNDNMLTSMKGGPEEVRGNYVCFGNNMNSMDGAPKTILGKFISIDVQKMVLDGIKNARSIDEHNRFHGA